MLSFHVKFVQTNRQTDGWTVGRTDRRTTVKQYAPTFRCGGIKSIIITVCNINTTARSNIYCIQQVKGGKDRESYGDT